MSVLEVNNLTKTYRGTKKAVASLSFKVEKGEIFALIGPNGAGKSTTLRMIATLLTPDSGTIKVGGHDRTEEADKVRAVISYLPEEAGAYKNLRGDSYLKFMANLHFKDAILRAERLDYAKSVTELKGRLKDKISTYSKGMTRKLLLARTVMVKPALAILDEPTSGLDVMNAFEIRTLIKNLAKEGMAVLLSSHNMLEIEFLSDRVGIINQGKLLVTGTPAGLKKKYNAKNLEEVFAKVVA